MDLHACVHMWGLVRVDDCLLGGGGLTRFWEPLPRPTYTPHRPTTPHPKNQNRPSAKGFTARGCSPSATPRSAWPHRRSRARCSTSSSASPSRGALFCFRLGVGGRPDGGRVSVFGGAAVSDHHQTTPLLRSSPTRTQSINQRTNHTGRPARHGARAGMGTRRRRCPSWGGRRDRDREIGG